MQAYDKFVRFHTLIAYFPTPYNLLAEFFINMNHFYLNDWKRSVSFFLVLNIFGSYCVHWKSFWCLSCDISSNFCLRYFFIGFRSIQEFVDRFTLFTIIWSRVYVRFADQSSKIDVMLLQHLEFSTSSLLCSGFIVFWPRAYEQNGD